MKPHPAAGVGTSHQQRSAAGVLKRLERALAALRAVGEHGAGKAQRLLGRASTLLGTVSWPSVETMVDVEIGATPLAGRIDAALRSRLVADSHAVLDRWTTDRGAEVPIEALFVVARKE